MRDKHNEQHTRKRGWLAAGINLCIVVLGVLIAIQIANWNESRLASREAEDLVSRLMDDLADEAWIHHYFVSYHEDVLSAAESTQDVVQSASAMRPETFLINAYRASQFTWWNPRRTAFDELVFKGLFEQIEDEDLRRQALKVYASPLHRDIVQAGRTSPYRVLFRRIVPTHVHEALSEACGDLTIPFGEYEQLPNVLSYDCDLELPPNEIDAAVQALITDPEFAPALRLRIANLKTELADLKEDNEVTQLFGRIRADTER